MRRALVARRRSLRLLGVIGLGLLSGCYSKLPDGNETAAYTWNDPVILKVGTTTLIGAWR
jgi:hypothetical protein